MKRALIIDDEDALRDIITEVVMMSSVESSAFPGGEDAVSYVAQGNTDFHLLIVDLNMPRLNGFETYIELKKYLPGIPVLFVSGFDQAHAGINVQEQEKQFFLKKPFSILELHEMVDRLINL
jgi:two-component system cell cycle sensor histidine kinase/response regulator CckA